ncbi:hypothetical protein ACXR2U_04235 [Jatrophihabitans sp. YIM 134969]
MSALWDRGSLPSRVAVATSSRVALAGVVLGALVAFVGGWTWALSVALGGGTVLLVLWGSARVLIAGTRKATPPVALLLALGLYLLAVIGLFVLAVVTRPVAGGDGPLQPAGVGAGVLGVVLCWTVALLVVHVRHDRGPRSR